MNTRMALRVFGCFIDSLVLLVFMVCFICLLLLSFVNVNDFYFVETLKKRKSCSQTCRIETFSYSKEIKSFDCSLGCLIVGQVLGIWLRLSLI